jgi:hypothetical protein
MPKGLLATHFKGAFVQDVQIGAIREDRLTQGDYLAQHANFSIQPGWGDRHFAPGAPARIVEQHARKAVIEADRP